MKACHLVTRHPKTTTKNNLLRKIYRFFNSFIDIIRNEIEIICVINKPWFLVVLKYKIFCKNQIICFNNAGTSSCRFLHCNQIELLRNPEPNASGIEGYKIYSLRSSGNFEEFKSRKWDAMGHYFTNIQLPNIHEIVFKLNQFMKKNDSSNVNLMI